MLFSKPTDNKQEAVLFSHSAQLLVLVPVYPSISRAPPLSTTNVGWVFDFVRNLRLNISVSENRLCPVLKKESDSKNH
jgi:CHASE1-domain containing sensor protein